MPIDYKQGKIYCLRSHQTEDIYIGSTVQPLHKRLHGHKKKYKGFLNKKNNYMSSYEIVKYTDVYIELICDCPCNSRNELCKEEGKHIRNNNCVNKRIEGRTLKEWYQDNKEKIKLYQKEHYQDNKEKINERHKQYYNNNKQYYKNYYEDNKENILLQQKQYYNDNKEKINERHKQYYNNNKQYYKNYYENNKQKLTKIYKCECGGTYQYKTKERHCKTKKHIKYLESL